MQEWIGGAAGENYLEKAGGDRRVTYAELAQWIASWKARLDRLGVPLGAPVAVILRDPLHYAVTLVSVLAAERVVVPLNPAAPETETAQLTAVARPAVTIADADPWSLVLHPGSPRRLADQGGILLCTSGTTGSPKAILLPAAQLRHVARGIAGHHRLEPGDRGLCPLPLFHVNAQVVGLLSTLVAGACLVLDDRFHRRGFWELVADQRITWINAVPAILAVLAATAEPGRPRNQVRFVRSASAPLPVSVLSRFEAEVGLPVLETYGMTEAASMITANPLGGIRKPGSVGLPVGVELRVVDARRRAVGQGEVGRVVIRGEGVITAYLAGGSPGDIDGGGWLDTKDLGFLDDDGYLYLVGRADDVINRGGENIYPREIEEVLRADAEVSDAAVVGRPDPVLGARPVAYVVAAEPGGDGAMAARLQDRCRSQLSAYKVPDEVHLVSDLPVGPTGKLARRALAELAALPS